VTSHARAISAAGTIGDTPRLAAAMLRVSVRSGFTHAFWMAAAASLVGLVAVALTPAQRRDPAVATEKK
jgi:hypothetical protein